MTDDARGERDESGIVPEALSINDTAALLSISRDHLHNLRQTGRFGPAPIKLGTSVRFIRQEIVAWLNAGAPRQEVWATMREGGRRDGG